MIRTVYQRERHGVTWLDITGPTPEMLARVAREHGLHALTVEDALDPEHLPKHERIEDALFLILRAWAPDRPGSALGDLTRKIAVFWRGDLVITIHRREVDAITRLEQHFLREHGDQPCHAACLVVALIHGTLASYDHPLDTAEATLDAFESALFSDGQAPPIRDIHHLKGRVSLIRRLLWLTLGVVHRLAVQDQTTPLLHDLREAADGYHFHADHLLDSANTLITTHLAMASHRTNDVVRILTLFSAFFLPLTFLAGLYGMNFRHMPELGAQWGYPAVLLLMLIIAGAVYGWFRARGWIGRARD